MPRSNFLSPSSHYIITWMKVGHSHLLKEKQYLLVLGDMHDNSGSIGMDDDSARVYRVGFTTDGGIGITVKKITIYVCSWNRVLDHRAALRNSKRYTDVTV